MTVQLGVTADAVCHGTGTLLALFHWQSCTVLQQQTGSVSQALKHQPLQPISGTISSHSNLLPAFRPAILYCLMSCFGHVWEHSFTAFFNICKVHKHCGHPVAPIFIPVSK
jgi:hypothetical protein